MARASSGHRSDCDMDCHSHTVVVLHFFGSRRYNMVTPAITQLRERIRTMHKRRVLMETRSKGITTIRSPMAPHQKETSAENDAIEAVRSALFDASVCEYREALSRKKLSSCDKVTDSLASALGTLRTLIMKRSSLSTKDFKESDIPRLDKALSEAVRDGNVQRAREIAAERLAMWNAERVW